MNIFPWHTGLRVCTEGVFKSVYDKKKQESHLHDKKKDKVTVAEKYIMFEPTICIRLVLSRGLLSWQPWKIHTRLKSQMICYYYKSLGVPQVILVLCEWSFLLHLILSFALTQAVDGVGDICMLNYCVKNVRGYRCSTSPIDFLDAFVLA